MRIKIGKTIKCLLVTAMTAFCASCEDDDPVYSPKPRGYVRINFPEKNYRLYDSICPYSFEIPVYSRMEADRHKGAEPCWLNLHFPQFKATIHLSYKTIEHNLSKYLEDSHDFAKRHEIKATGLEETPVIRDSARVYGLLFDISGNTASSLQFYLTDSTSHFLRGALYFNSVPNSDSLKIVIDYLKQDILHLIRTTRWKQTDAKTR
jgi:gliding motility-associated lipoprotein GldD